MAGRKKSEEKLLSANSEMYFSASTLDHAIRRDWSQFVRLVDYSVSHLAVIAARRCEQEARYPAS